MANVRPQLLFYGLSRNNIASYDQGLTREEVLDWIQGNSSWNRFEFSHPYNPGFKIRGAVERDLSGAERRERSGPLQLRSAPPFF